MPANWPTTAIKANVSMLGIVASLVYFALAFCLYRFYCRALSPEMVRLLQDVASINLKHAAALWLQRDDDCLDLACALDRNATTFLQGHWEPHMWVRSIERLEHTLPICLAEHAEASVGAVRSLFAFVEVLAQLAQQGASIRGGEDRDIAAAHSRLRRLLVNLNDQKRA